MGEIEELENALANVLGRRHCIITGRGASAIYIALKAIKENPAKVVMPAICCNSPANVSISAGWEPIFCDIRLEDFNMCPRALTRTLEDNSDIGAIMPVHLYGQAAPMKEILTIAAEHNIPVIEDSAQALGATYKGHMVGSLGDISIISFGHTKTLDIGWGGAALTDNDYIAERLRLEQKQLPRRPLQIDQLFDEWRKVYYSLLPLTEMNSKLHILFTLLPQIFNEMYVFSLNREQASDILNSLNSLDSLVSARRVLANAYRENLIHPDLVHPSFDPEAAPWRYSFLVGRGLQKTVTEELRAAGLDASNWYPSLHRWYPSSRKQDPTQFETALRIESEVVNLWVTPSLSMDTIHSSSNIVLRCLA